MIVILPALLSDFSPVQTSNDGDFSSPTPIIITAPFSCFIASADGVIRSRKGF